MAAILVEAAEMMRKLLAILALLVLGLPGDAQAQSAWRIDPAKTEIGFVTRKFGAVVARGRFARYDGVLALDFDRPERSRIRLTIETASVGTGSTTIDTFLKGPSMLDTARFPMASFNATRVSAGSDHAVEIAGQLTIRTIAQPFAVQVMLDGNPETARRGERFAFHGSGTFLRPEFDLGRDVNVVDDAVEITIRGEVTAR
jgi:polyisoprenoid-binding protein YceI